MSIGFLECLKWITGDIFWFLGDLKSIMVVVIDANGPILDQID